MPAQRHFIHCQRLFTGLEDVVRRDQTLVVEQGRGVHPCRPHGAGAGACAG